MQSCLISASENMCALVTGVAGPSLVVRSPSSALPEADVYIWDFEPGEFVANSRSKPQAKHIYLVARKDLERFDASVAPDEALIILKPVNRGILAAFFTAHLEPVRAKTSSLGELRADRDTILQYALETNLKLQEYDERRTNFLARALHDFRAPLTALRGYCELLLDGELGPMNEQQISLLERMRNSAQRLERLTSGMFELSVEGHVERTLQLEQAEIESCVDQAIHELAPFLQEREIVVDVQMNPPEQPLFIEPHQIEQVIVNLVENSCRFTPKCGEIEIRGYSIFWDPVQRDLDDSSQEPNAYRVDVKDTGPGIESSLVEKIFEQYTSYNSSSRSGGLGLAICRMIVETHGGAIWVEPEMKGALFSFVIPFERQKMAAVAHPGPEGEGPGLASARVA